MWSEIDDNLVPESQRKNLTKRFNIVRTLSTRTSDNPLGAIWRELQRYAGLQRAKRLFPQQTDDATRTFCAYVELADSYASLAEDAEISLDPLLMYYAAMWLSRALIAARLGVTTAAAQKAHGAKPVPGETETLRMLAGTVTIQKRGTLPTLIEALAGNATPGQVIRLVDLFRALPEMDYVLSDTINQQSSAIKINVHPDVLAKIASGHQISLDGPVNLDTISTLPIAPALKERGAKLALFAGGAIVWYSEHNIEDELATLCIHTHEGYFAENRINGSYIPELAVYVAILHALSEFTRYYPREWLDVYSEHGADYSLIREFMHLAERKVPELVLSELSSAKTIFAYG